MLKFVCSIFILTIFSCALPAQHTGWISGKVQNHRGKAIAFVNLGLAENPVYGTSTDDHGNFILEIPANREFTLFFSFVGFRPFYQSVSVSEGDTLHYIVTLKKKATKLPEVIIQSGIERNQISVFTLDPKKVQSIPLPSNNFESILKTIGLGVSSAGGELSSQYSVRGGNFDENLIYVNDFEIYRPQLIRSGQQEGLSFINPELVNSISFSSGGFEAKYGDKMSSVLDVKYKRPDSLEIAAEASLLGASLSLQNRSRNYRWMYLLGLRQKSNQYLLNSLNTKGEYKPSFTDAQALIIFRATPSLEFQAIGNMAYNTYRFVPESRISSIGTVDNVKQLEVFFDGQELDKFSNYMGGLSATYAADSNKLRLKFMASLYHSLETETFDIIGDYFLYQVENNLGQKDFGQRVFGLGYGTFQNYGRNYLDALVSNIAHKGYLYKGNHFLEWGLKYQNENISDKLNEWERIDSAFYSLPYDTAAVNIWSVLKSKNNLISNRYSGYFQDTWVITPDSLSDMNLTAGARFQYWDLNKEWLISPRAQFSFKPSWERDVILKASAGLYQQAPFYRELRDLQGIVHTDVKAQKSIHFVLGSDFIFKAWNRDFRLITEAYYKQMWDLIPYDVEDVRIRYYGKNMSKGYATGIDVRLNGEFVKGAESWINVSVMQTQEDIVGDYHYDADTNWVERGYIPRPTDQRVNVGILFQDYFPGNENFKMHLNMLFGSGLPFGPPNSPQFRNVSRIPPYRRVDIGFSALLLDPDRELTPNNFFRHFHSIWASLEVFNLLGIQNTISHIWVKDNYNNTYAFENHLTSRRLNLRVIVRL